MPVNLLRSDPADGFSIIGVETIRLYFDNRPTDVKITEASEDIHRAIVKGNTVEVSITQPVFARYIHFTITWSGGKARLVYPNDPDDHIADFLMAWPADGSSIVGVNEIQVCVGGIPENAKCYNHTSESFIDVGTFTNTIYIDVPHPIREPSISFTVSWTSRDKTKQNSKKLTYTNKDTAPEETEKWKTE